MDDQFRQEVLEVVAALAKSQQEKLAAAGTFVDVEELTAEVGDEVARQLANWELSRRSEALCEHPRHACPDCGKQCSIAPDLEPIILQGLRGEIEGRETHFARWSVFDKTHWCKLTVGSVVSLKGFQGWRRIG